MKYIKNKFDDEVSKVTRDMIVDYPLFKSKRRMSEYGPLGDDGKRDMVQVYPWENIQEGIHDGTSVKHYHIDGKWFVTKGVWDAYVEHRRINFGELVAYVNNDRAVQLHRHGLVGFTRRWLAEQFKKLKEQYNVRNL